MKFFVLQNPKAGEGLAVTDFLAVEGVARGNAPQCPTCGKYISMRQLLPPVRVELEGWGVLQWGDMAFGTGDLILFSTKLTTLFLSAGLVGFMRLDPVEVVKIACRRPMPGTVLTYQLATVLRSRVALDECASNLVRDEAPVCSECRIGGLVKRIDRVVLEPNTWSGEDIFYCRGLPGTLLTSERFKLLAEQHSLANVHLIPALEYSFDHYP